MCSCPRLALPVHVVFSSMRLVVKAFPLCFSEAKNVLWQLLLQDAASFILHSLTRMALCLMLYFVCHQAAFHAQKGRGNVVFIHSQL